jgi:hypothetical protein
MSGRARGEIDAYTPPCKTIAGASSQPNFEALAVHVVLLHPRAAFHRCMCGLHRGVVALISYDDVEVAVGMTTRRRRSRITTSSTPTCGYIRSLLQLFFRCSVCLVVTIHDLLLASILGWHGRSSASVAYPFPYKDVLRVHEYSRVSTTNKVLLDGQ